MDERPTLLKSKGQLFRMREEKRNVMSTEGSRSILLASSENHIDRHSEHSPSLRQLYVRGFVSDTEYVHLWDIVMTSITAHRSAISNPGLISGQRGCFANENLGRHNMGGFS